MSGTSDELAAAVLRALEREDFEAPHIARVADFTDAEVRAGTLREADEEAERKNVAAVRRVLDHFGFGADPVARVREDK